MNKDERERVLAGKMTKEELLILKNNLQHQLSKNTGFIIGSVILIFTIIFSWLGIILLIVGIYNRQSINEELKEVSEQLILKSNKTKKDESIETLKRTYAKGKISHKEFLKRKKVLKEE